MQFTKQLKSLSMPMLRIMGWASGVLLLILVAASLLALIMTLVTILSLCCLFLSIPAFFRIKEAFDDTAHGPKTAKVHLVDYVLSRPISNNFGHQLLLAYDKTVGKE